MTVLDLARNELRKRTAYSTASGQRDFIRLHANESPWSGGDGLNRYPPARSLSLARALAATYSVATENVLPTRGSDDGIDLLIRAFCRAGKDSITINTPTFGMYASFAEIQGASIVTTPLVGDDFQIDVSKLTKQQPRSKLVFVCTPNNPTGNSTPLSEIEGLCSKLDGSSIVVVDEAYLEFCDGPSASILLDKHENLVVLRTLSKAYGMAGLRCGAVLATPTIIELLASISAPYALPSPCLELALEKLAPDGLQTMAERVQVIRQERQALAEKLIQHSDVVQIWPSETNFLLIRFKNASTVRDLLSANNILVRDFSRLPGLDNCLRITVGSPEENISVTKALGIE